MGVSTFALALMLANTGPGFASEGNLGTTGKSVPSALGEQTATPLQAVPAATEAMPPATTPTTEPASAPESTPTTEPTPAPESTPALPDATGTAPEAEPDNVIVVNASPRHIRADPLSGFNAAAFDAVTMVDEAVVAPVAGTYEKTVPEPVRNGLRNVLSNLAEPIVFLNYLLQFKPGKALETAGRFGINSTIGIAGLFDMAKRKPFHLPYRQNGFANTLGYHGVGPGAYLFLPVLGPTSVRDLAGRLADIAVVPTIVGHPFNKPAYSISTSVVKALNDRVAFDDQIMANRAAADPYIATRDFYLKRRQTEINALHSPEFRARRGIPAPPLAPVPPPVNDNTP